MKDLLIRSAAAMAALSIGMGGASAQDKPANTLGLGGYWDTIAFSGHVEGGATFNPDGPGNRINYGHLFTDKSNQFLLNQVMGTAERPLDLKAPGYDIGFKLQAFFGSDARYTHFLYEGDDITDGRNQFDIVEANLMMHTPWLTPGGVDFKIGQFPTLLGYEVIPATGNFFYSHSYIFQFGLPFKHTGGYTTVHALPWLDVHAGVTTGVNTSAFGGDNNDAPSFIGGATVTLFDGNLAIAYATHIGPEQPESTRSTLNFSPGADKRQYHDVYVTWKITDAFTSVTELNFVRDSAANAVAKGIGQYLLYKMNDWLSFGVRGEIFRSDAFYVGEFPDNKDFIEVLKGDPKGVQATPVGSTTFAEITFGANIKPLAQVKYLEGFTIRPEIRYDHTIDNVRPYKTDGNNVGQSDRQLTVGIDFILPF